MLNVWIWHQKLKEVEKYIMVNEIDFSIKHNMRDEVLNDSF